MSGIYKNQVLMQYIHDYTIAMFSKNVPLSYQINNTEQNINEGYIRGKDYVGMSSDSSISYNIGVIKPGEEAKINFIIAVYDSRNTLEEIEEENNRLKKIEISKKYMKGVFYYFRYYITMKQVEFQLLQK